MSVYMYVYLYFLPFCTPGTQNNLLFLKKLSLNLTKNVRVRKMSDFDNI